METVEINLNRLMHLLTLYRLSKDDLLARLNTGRKTPLPEKDIFVEAIKIGNLKKIDEIFKKGLSYYFDPKNPTNSKEESIFFRKDVFNANLSLGAKQIVNKFEEEKIEFSSLAKLSDFKLNRVLPNFKISDNPKVVASHIRKSFFAPFVIENKRDFLKHLIAKFAEFNILVFEFIETHNKKEKANINGFYLSPNVIVLKRNQKALKREIFTFAHEFGHYLLSDEEIDDNIYENDLEYTQLSLTERWCNDFAFYFLIGDDNQLFDSLSVADTTNNFNKGKIEELSRKTYLSSLALYTRLLLDERISPFNYKKVKGEILKSIEEYQKSEKERLELERRKAVAQGKESRGSVPQPIISPLYLSTMKSALYYGLINEVQFCKKLNIKPDKLEKYLL